MNVLQLIASSSFITVNKSIAKELGLAEAVILGALCSEYIYCHSHDIHENGFFPFSTNRLQEETTLGESSQRSAIKHLCERGIIEQKNFGQPNQRHFRIIEEGLFQFLENQGTSSSKIKELNPSKSRNYINNNNIYTFDNNKDSVIKSETEELTADEQVKQIIQAWNQCKYVKTKIDRILPMQRRWNDTFICIHDYGFDSFLDEIKRLDDNGWFREWQPTYDWFCNPNNFLKVYEGNYRDGKKQYDEKPDYYDELMRWANDEE